MQRRERWTIAVVFALFIAAHFAVLTAYRRVSAHAAIDIGFADSLGHPALVGSFERSLAKRSTPEVTYVAAVANELAHNLARADELYARLPDDPRAAAARGKLDQPRRIIAPTAAELLAVYSEPWRPLLERFDATGFGELVPVIDMTSIAVFVSGVVLLILFLGLKPSEPPQRRPRASKLLYLLVPGAYDLRHGSHVRGAFLTVLTGFVIWLALAMRYAFPVQRSPGVLTATSLPNITLAFPFPPVSSAIDLMLAPIYARQFWLIAIVAVVSWVVLHASRIPAVLRKQADA